MGLMDKLFGSKDGRPRKLVKLEKKILNMYLQPQDRQYYLDQLRQESDKEHGHEAIMTLMKRFTCKTDNNTVDRDEKKMVYEFLVGMGPLAIEPVKEFLRQNEEGINWPFKALTELLPRKELLDFLVEMFEEHMSPDYARNPERKEQMVLLARDFASEERVARAVVPYLDDHSENIRFHAVETLLANGSDWLKEPLQERIVEDDSIRITTKLCDAFVEKLWEVDDVDAIEAVLPDDYKVIRNRTIKKKR